MTYWRTCRARQPVDVQGKRVPYVRLGATRNSHSRDARERTGTQCLSVAQLVRAPHLEEVRVRVPADEWIYDAGEEKSEFPEASNEIRTTARTAVDSRRLRPPSRTVINHARGAAERVEVASPRDAVARVLAIGAARAAKSVAVKGFEDSLLDLAAGMDSQAASLDSRGNCSIAADAYRDCATRVRRFINRAKVHYEKEPMQFPWEKIKRD